MKCSVRISTILKEISSYSILLVSSISALFSKEDFISPYYSLKFCIQLDIYYYFDIRKYYLENNLLKLTHQITNLSK